MKSPLALLAFVLVSTLAAQPAAEPPIRLADVVVTPSRFGVTEERTTIGATLTSAELETLPQVGDDLYRSIARLPGLAADDITAQFWVRGAPHSELLARLDGLDLIEPFHLKDVDGALSIVDPQTISRLELTTGGFTSEFGDRLAGVLTLETKSALATHSALGISLTGVSGMHQHARGPQSESWFVAARRGYPDIALRIAGRDDDISPRYYDAMAKLEFRPTPTQTIAIEALHAGDSLRYHRQNDPSLRSGYDSSYLWARWRGGFGTQLSGEAVLSGTRLTWKRDGSGLLDGFPFALSDRRQLDVVALRNEWNFALGERALLRAGVEAKRGSSEYRYALSRQFSTVIAGRQTTVPVNLNTALDPDGEAWGAFASARLRPARNVIVEPGVRFDRHTWIGESDVSPRLNAAVGLGRGTLRLAWGRYAQAQGLHEIAVADGETAFQRREWAEHRVIGFEHPLTPALDVRVEAYERRITQPRARWDNLDNAYDLFPEAQPDRVRLAPSAGRARGLEFLVTGRRGTAFVWHVSYALTRAEETIAGRTVPRARDQRHTAYADLTYAPSKEWQFSAAWQFHTGWPTTDVVYSLASLTNGRRVLVSAIGAAYGLRLPDYHRLDLRATRRFALRHGELRAFLDVFNAYNRTNLVGYIHRVTVSGTQVTDVKNRASNCRCCPAWG